MENSLGIGSSPCTPCDPPIYDGAGHFIRCGGCVVDCGLCKKCVYAGTLGYVCQDKFKYPMACCDCQKVCNWNSCEYCDDDYFAYCRSYCDPNLCQTCDGNGLCPVCNGDPNKSCCYGECYRPKDCKYCEGTTQSVESTCDPNQCQDCNTTTGTCQVCGGDPNKTCCYGNCCNKKICEECNDITQSCQVCGGRPGEDCCPNNVGCFKPPSGCDGCGTSTSVTPTPNEQNGCSYCGGNAGVFVPGSASYTLKIPCYKSCKWEVQLDTVTATVYICRSCPANSPTVACLSDVAGMTQAQACAHKLNFPHDPFQYADRSTANWCGDCISDHENRHKTFWLDTCLQPQIADFQSWLAAHPIDVTSASNCTTAMDSNWQAQCTAEWNTLMTIAVTTWNDADLEPPAEAAESACYQSILDALKAKCP